MFASERQRVIEKKIAADGRVAVRALAAEMNVSVETIRRDLRRMDEQGLLKQVHGGAIAADKELMLRNLAMSQRRERDMQQRAAIAQAAAEMIQPGDVIALNAGLTMDEMAKRLPDGYGLTVFTFSISALNILVERLNNHTFSGQVYMLGGCADPFDMCVSGEMVEQCLKHLHVDKAFVAPTTVNADGAMISNMSEGRHTALLVKNASQSFLLATSARFGYTSLYQFGALEDFQGVLTDDAHSLPQDIQKRLEMLAVPLQICKSTK